MSLDLQTIAKSFAIEGALQSIAPFGSGHINETYRSVWQSDVGTRAFIHQRINHNVFKDVAVVMKNIAVVTRHVRQRIAQTGTSRDETLTIVPTREGKDYLADPALGFWRTYLQVENSESFDICPDAAHAEEAARTFGRFLAYLSDLNPGMLGEPIPRFQDTGLRYEQLEAALQSDSAMRKEAVASEIEFAISRRPVGLLIMEALRKGTVPLRATHSDPKVNNVLFNTNTKRGFCVVDLDTCMPGSILYDFGDLVRSTAVPSAEDEVDLSKVHMSAEYYSSLTKGFLESFRSHMTAREIELLPFAPRVIALTLGIRFLTDYLNGDVYFRVHRPQQNLDRCRAQFQIVRSMEAQQEYMQAAVAGLLAA
ncbi:MAG: aminoglycoside phosphotransferase family protein [Deltaproteobacteria bacterium]|nr:aminoglycoside phosphotransferase family protein [Deltaproteobacteria bacterium]